MKILFIGDIIGAFGRAITKQLLPALIREYFPDFVFANGENSAHGYGITLKIYNELLDAGINALSMGNHVWDKKDIIKYIEKFEMMARPANYPKGVPGKEYLIVSDNKGNKIALVNLVGRVFMPPIDDPFQTLERLIPEIKKQTQSIIVDIHAEATSEKTAIGAYFDGRVSAVLGTHTHVMTADDRIMPNGTGFISDIGMVGSQDSIIGMKKEQILKRFLTGIPEKFEPEDQGIGLFNAVFLEIDSATGKCLKIDKLIRTVNL